MAKNSIRDYSATNSSNTDIQSIDISEGCSPAGINNAIREVMADLKDVSTGAVALESPAMDSLTVTGDLTVDTNTLYVDSTNNRVGIGTSSPSSYGRLAVMTPTATFGYFGIDNSVGGGGGVNIGSYYGTTKISYIDTVLENGTPSSEQSRLQFAIISGGTLAERMRIDSSGNLLVGTTSANFSGSGRGLIELNGSSDSLLSLKYGDTAGLYLYTASGEGRVAQFANLPMTFFTNNTERMRIDSSGNLLVGTTSAGGEGVTIRGAQGGNFWSSKSNTISADNQLAFYNPNGLVGYIQTSGTSTSYVTSSDHRLKENVVADWDATTRLKQLNPVRFNFISDADTTVDGFLAHEVQDIVPEAITGTKDAMMDEEYQVSAATGDIYTPATEAVLDEDGNEVTPAVAEVIHSTDVERPEELAEGQQWRETTAAVMGTRSVPDYQGIDQSKLVPLLVKTIQELEARITALEAN